MICPSPASPYTNSTSQCTYRLLQSSRSLSCFWGMQPVITEGETRSDYWCIPIYHLSVENLFHHNNEAIFKSFAFSSSLFLSSKQIKSKDYVYITIIPLSFILGFAQWRGCWWICGVVSSAGCPQSWGGGWWQDPGCLQSTGWCNEGTTECLTARGWP